MTAEALPESPEPSETATTVNTAGGSGVGHRRQRYGRFRGAPPPGDSFVARLGPASAEAFAGLDDPEDEALAPSPGHDTPIDDLRFVALDCETTGQSPHRLLELGAVAFTLDRHIMSFETLVHSTDRINPYARRIHGISSDTLGGAPPADRVLARFRRFARGGVLVEHSADAFDTRLISSAMENALDAESLDTSRMAAALWDLRDTIGLERLCNELGVQHRRPHHALADAEATAACFLELLRLGRERFGWRTLGDLLAVAQPPPPRPPDARRGGRSRSQPTSPRRRRRGGRKHRGGSSGSAPVASAPSED